MGELVIKFRKHISKADFSDIFFRIFLILTGAVILVLIVILKAKTAKDFSVAPLLLLYTVFITSFELSRLVGALFYKSSLSAVTDANLNNSDRFEPTISFVIPCKNEEASIEKTISKCFAAEYPKNKLEVIIINDGSTDGTLKVLNKLKRRIAFKKLVIVNWRKNRGKRHAMAIGFKIASGEIVIQLDSDSYIEPHTIKYLIEPFKNPEIGAVCAHADPENSDENFMTRMQAAYYFMSFRIFKAAESTFLSVFCCSGCSSAYRKSIVLPILDDWLNEKFLGLPVTWGDDRALTSWILKGGQKTLYTDKAKAYTIVPNNFRQLLKQQLRWKKSWVINSIITGRFIYKEQPFIAFAYFFPLVAISILTPFVAFASFIYAPILKGIIPYNYVLGVLLVTLLFVLYYRYLSPKNKYWPYLFVWQILNMIIFCYLIIYAIIRIQDRGWGTR